MGERMAIQTKKTWEEKLNECVHPAVTCVVMCSIIIINWSLLPSLVSASLNGVILMFQLYLIGFSRGKIAGMGWVLKAWEISEEKRIALSKVSKNVPN